MSIVYREVQEDARDEREDALSPEIFNTYPHVQPTAEQNIILRNAWTLLYPIRNLLTQPEELYICTVDTWINKLVSAEEYPRTFTDTIQINKERHYVTYLNCSGNFLEDLASDNPQTELLFKIRRFPKPNSGMSSVCLCRQFKRDWNREFLIQNKGAKELG